MTEVVEHYGWFVVKDEFTGQMHVMPTHEGHIFDDCRCQPWENKEGVMVHNSFDGRESYEKGERQKS